MKKTYSLLLVLVLSLSSLLAACGNNNEATETKDGETKEDFKTQIQGAPVYNFFQFVLVFAPEPARTLSSNYGPY
ncbi:hypothetical protein GCM10009865_51450 [Aeromicrobium ponti]|uniref:Uncharacterized protein n=1 Tax=Cytobacillus oceanisediminis TaxID=665099 RepID=A0A562J7A6_9BACI|nr:hypothetical protein [Cytobacillus oceanisediminis]TWH78933.1 hypothetical protein IQ19_05132 [Cytobacillus oceanisediminis]